MSTQIAVSKDEFFVVEDSDCNFTVITDNSNQVVGTLNNTATVDVVDGATLVSIVAEPTTITEAPGSAITTIGIQGPTGPQGPIGPPSVEEEVPFAKQVNFISDNLLYRGEADPGTLTSAATWRCRKITIDATDSDITETWANGDSNFDKIWDNHLSFTYI